MNFNMFYVLIDLAALSYLINDLRTNKHQGRMKLFIILGILLFAVLSAVNLFKVFSV